jgi:RNase adaptor protein for sRNA GlmZ degradation
MQRTIAVSQPVLFIECSDAGRETAWNMLQDMGYRCQSAITCKIVNAFDEYRHSDFLWLPPRLEAN